MVMRTVLRHTLLMSASHFFVRILGFFMRIWLSRELGSQAMGLVELASSVQMLLITPITSGLPAAVSRMCAKADADHQKRIALGGVVLSLAASLPLSAAAYMLREPIALWLGDIRTLPALLVYLPCIPVLGISCVLNGYFYGAGKPLAPAAGEIIEQIIRLFLCIQLASLLKTWPMMLRAAIPATAALAGETASLALMLLLSFKIFLPCSISGICAHLPEMLSLAIPLTGMRLVSSLMRTVNTMLIPARLQIAGIPRSEALTGLGMVNGMMMPILMIPSFITVSLCMAASPELTRRQFSKKTVRRMISKLLWASGVVGTLAASAVFVFAPFIADRLYRQAELLPMLRRSCPLVPVIALTQVTGGIMNALGLQRYSLRISLYTSFLSLLLLYVLAAAPSIGLWGVVISMAASHTLTLTMNLLTLRRETALSA